jgi:hypothetical protein
LLLALGAIAAALAQSPESSGGNAAGLDVPITFEDTAGVRRAAEPVTFGVPLPQGVVGSVDALRLHAAGGNAVPAAFRIAARWPDGSVRWAHCDFFADVEARGRSVYRLRASGAPAPAASAAVRVEQTPAGVTVDTGALRFTVPRNGPVLDAPGLRGADFLVRSDERIYKASNWRTSTLEVEERNGLRVVLKRTGAHGWVAGPDRALDYVLRVIAYAGKPYIKLVYSFVNRQGDNMTDFVRLDGLWLEAQLERETPPMKIEQLSSEPRRPGWFTAGSLGFGVRWFWQLYPKGFEVRDRLARLALYPESARPQNIYTGVAKTHELLLSFDGGNHVAQLDEPLYGAAPPRWYTRDTKALGRLVEASPELIQPQHRALAARYEQWLVRSRDAVLGKRDRPVTFEGRTFDEYGMLDFGDALHKLVADSGKPDYGVHWDTEYYDFPHTLFLHFFRTGDLKSLRTAVEAAAHLADVDISHYEVEPGGRVPGAARTGPGLNHWTRYSNGQFISSGSWAFYKNEGLFDRYLLTGDLWSRDAARLSADWGVLYNGLDLQSNTRSIGHGLFALMKAYEVFGERKYIDRVQWIIDTVHAWQDGDVEKLKTLNRRAVWHPRFRGGYSDQAWMYGIALEAMAQAHLLLGRPEMPEYMRRAADWVLSNPKEYDPARDYFYRYQDLAVMLTPGLAYITETSGDQKYFDLALRHFTRQVNADATTDRLKLFAQWFRNSQRFLWYLSIEGNPRTQRSSESSAAARR